MHQLKPNIFFLVGDPLQKINQKTNQNYDPLRTFKEGENNNEVICERENSMIEKLTGQIQAQPALAGDLAFGFESSKVCASVKFQVE
jgi:hypothetical protein